MLRKKLGCLLATALMVTTMVPTGAIASPSLQASSTITTYGSADGDYTFEKISHPDQGTMTPDGIVDYLGNGEVGVPDGSGDYEGDRGQSYSWAAAAYGDYLYVGTCNSAMGSTLTLMKSILGDKFDKDIMEASLKAMYNGTFYQGHEDGVDSDGILVKMNTKTGELTLLMSEALNGIAPYFRNAVVYNGKLYFCGSMHINGRTGLPMVYQVDPETDEYKPVYQGLSNMYDYAAAFKAGICTGIRGMTVYDGRLVISCVYMDSSTGESGVRILESSDPDSGFTQVANSDDLFNYPAYHYRDSVYGGSIWDMTEYNGSLYVSICTGTADNAPDDNSMQSFAIVRGDRNSDGSYTWTPVVGDKDDGARYTFGIDPERTRSAAASLMVYNGYLYIGEYNDEQIALERIIFNKTGADADGNAGGVDCSFVNANLEQSVNLYRMDEDEDMELVVGNATAMFPNGSLSGLGSGWGSNENQYVWQMSVYDNKLYVGTFDTSSLLEPIGRFSNGDIINMTPEEWKTQIQYLKELVQLLLEKNGGATPAALSADADGADAVASADDQMAAELQELCQGLEDAEGYLAEGGAVATASEGGSDADIDQMIEYHKTFAEYYQGLLDTFEKLQQKYGLPSDIIERLQKLLSKENLERVQSVIECMGYLRDATRGFDLYVTEDGVNFETVTKDGFGDPYNHGLRVFAATDQGLCIGTANPFNGTQLWIQRGYEVTYDANGGEGSVEDSSRYESGESAIVLANGFTREGYTFAGWNTAADGTGTAYKVDDEIEMNDAVTLYAQWTKDAAPDDKGDGDKSDDKSDDKGDDKSDDKGDEKTDDKSDGDAAADEKPADETPAEAKPAGEKPAPAQAKAKKATPETGDASSPALIAAAALAGASCVILARKASSRRED